MSVAPILKEVVGVKRTIYHALTYDELLKQDNARNERGRLRQGPQRIRDILKRKVLPAGCLSSNLRRRFAAVVGSLSSVVEANDSQ